MNTVPFSCVPSRSEPSSAAVTETMLEPVIGDFPTRDRRLQDDLPDATSG